MNMPTTPARDTTLQVSPAHAEAGIARDVLERVLHAVQCTPGHLDRAELASTLTSAIAAVTNLLQSELDDADHLSKLESATVALDEAQWTLALQPVLEAQARDVAVVHDALGACRLRVVDAQGSRRRFHRPAPDSVLDDGEAFRAGLVSAQLVRIRRAPLVFTMKSAVPEEDSIVADAFPFDGKSRDDENPVPGKTAQSKSKPSLLQGPDRAGVEGEEAMLRLLARELMEDIGTLGSLYRPSRARAWSRGVVDFEDRLLAAFDALVALGLPIESVDRKQFQFDVLEELLRYSSTDISDPSRAFARTFVLSCVEGEDRVHTAVVALRQAHPFTYSAHRDAFILGSSPAIAPAMERLCENAPKPLVRVALEVLTARREGTAETAAALLEHPDPAIRIRAVRLLGVTPDQPMADSLLAQVIAEEPDTRIAAAAMRAMVRRGEPFGLEAARQALSNNGTAHGELHSDARLDLLELLGITGNAGDIRLLQARPAYRPREAEALGWHGSPGHVEPLLAALENCASMPGKSLSCAGIARALQRITGADIFDASGHPWVNATAWRAHWQKTKALFDPERRYRFGRPYLPIATLDELTKDGPTGADRESCVLELDALTAGTASIGLSRWSALVDAEVQRLRSFYGKKPRHADGSGFSPGDWISSQWLRRRTG